MIVIGITGSIGMGKSTVAKMLSSEYGAPIHDADAVVRNLIGPKGAAVSAVAKTFPESFNKKAKEIDRVKLANSVFGNDQKRKALEGILHPMVRDAQKKFLKENAQKKLVALDIPLLFETGGEKNCDYTICVSAPEDIQQKRVLARGMSLKAFKSRVAAQMSDAEKQRRADFVVKTEVSIADTLEQLKEVMRKIGLEPEKE